MKVQFLILKWLAFWWYPNIQSSRAIEELHNKVSLWSRTKGDLWVITHLKEIRLLYTRHLCGHPVHSSDHIIGIRRDGLPKGLQALNEIYLIGSREAISFVLTCLSLSRSIKSWKDPDLSTISKPFSGSISDFRIFRSFIKRFMKDFKIYSFKFNWSTEDLYYSTKAGPNGLATWSSPIDSRFLPESLSEAFEGFSEDLANFSRRWRNHLSEVVLSTFTSKKVTPEAGLIRRLSMVLDPEGKCRIIAIFDYYSQVLLMKIHKRIFRILRRIPQDRTFTQNPIVDFEGPYYSLDLSAATDRFPIAFQKEVMRYLIGSKLADLWASILVDHEFYVPWNNQTVKYSVGQPMGAYSSWAVFTLSHHIIIQYAAFLIGEYPTRKYIILGDDIVVGGQRLAESYQEVMAMLGVEISSHKTHVSTNTYEFAKRWFRNGQEVSGMQINGFMETWSNYSLLYQTLRTYLDRGFVPFGATPLPQIIFSLLLTLGVRLRKSLNIYNKVEVLHEFYKWIHKGDAESIRTLLISKYPNDAFVPHGSHPNFIDWISMRISRSFQVMYHEVTKGLEDYMEKVENKLFSHIDFARLTEVENDSELDGLILPGDLANHPVLISLRNQYMNLSRDERLSNPELDYINAIEALCIPDPDKIGAIRTSFKVALVTSKLAQKTLNTHKNVFRVGGPGYVIEAQWFSNH